MLTGGTQDPGKMPDLASGSHYDPGSGRLGQARAGLGGEAARLQWMKECVGGETCSPDSAAAAGALRPQVRV